MLDMVDQQAFEEKLNGILDEAADKRGNGDEAVAVALEELVLMAAVDRWNWELDDSGVERRGRPKGRMGHLLR